MKPERPPSADLFTPRTPDVQPLLERIARREQAATPWPPPSAAAAVRSLFAPPPAQPPPAPLSLVHHPDVQRHIAELSAEAEQVGLQRAEARVEAVIERYIAAIRELGERTAATRLKAAEVVSLAMVVAREIVGRELRVDGEPLLSALDEALRQVGTHAAIVVRLGRDDLDYVKRRRPDLTAAGVELVLDESLGAGGCIVEAPDQIVDGSVESRLAAARDAVAAALDRDHDALLEGDRQSPGTGKAVAC